MTIIEIIYKKTSNMATAVNSKMLADITSKEDVWLKYGSQNMADIWANQILAHTFIEPCTLIQSKVTTK